jgi:hypothetical protein
MGIKLINLYGVKIAYFCLWSDIEALFDLFWKVDGVMMKTLGGLRHRLAIHNARLDMASTRESLVKKSMFFGWPRKT